MVVAAAVLAGCGPGTAGPTATGPAPPGLSTDRAAYAPGDSIALRLRPERTVSYNLCHADVERRSSDGWSGFLGEYRLPYPEDRARGVHFSCQDIAYVADSGQVGRFAFRLSDRLPAGTYRLHATVRPEPSSPGEIVPARVDTVWTEPFVVD